jgi:hypothetical protein
MNKLRHHHRAWNDRGFGSGRVSRSVHASAGRVALFGCVPRVQSRDSAAQPLTLDARWSAYPEPTRQGAGRFASPSRSGLCCWPPGVALSAGIARGETTTHLGPPALGGGPPFSMAAWCLCRDSTARRPRRHHIAGDMTRIARTTNFAKAETGTHFRSWLPIRVPNRPGLDQHEQSCDHHQHPNHGRYIEPRISSSPPPHRPRGHHDQDQYQETINRQHGATP